MIHSEAEQIAALLNSRNRLTVQYTAERILAHTDNYLTHKAVSGEVIGCVEVKSVQWYQCELLHLTVAERYARKGIARSLLGSVTQASLDKNARVLQCTIRSGNDASERLFLSVGFFCVSTFFNRVSNNAVGVWQKVLSPAA